jgi:hypothetical protein
MPFYPWSVVSQGEYPTHYFLICFTLDSQLSALGSLGVLLDVLLLPNYKKNQGSKKKPKEIDFQNF